MHETSLEGRQVSDDTDMTLVMAMYVVCVLVGIVNRRAGAERTIFAVCALLVGARLATF